MFYIRHVYWVMWAREAFALHCFPTRKERKFWNFAAQHLTLQMSRLDGKGRGFRTPAKKENFQHMWPAVGCRKPTKAHSWRVGGWISRKCPSMTSSARPFSWRWWADLGSATSGQTKTITFSPVFLSFRYLFITIYSIVLFILDDLSESQLCSLLFNWLII